MSLQCSFVVKTVDSEGRKVFINMCGSPQVAPPGDWQQGQVQALLQSADTHGMGRLPICFSACGEQAQDLCNGQIESDGLSAQHYRKHADFTFMLFAQTNRCSNPESCQTIKGAI